MQEGHRQGPVSWLAVCRASTDDYPALFIPRLLMNGNLTNKTRRASNLDIDRNDSGRRCGIYCHGVRLARGLAQSVSNLHSEIIAARESGGPRNYSVGRKSHPRR